MADGSAQKMLSAVGGALAGGGEHASVGVTTANEVVGRAAGVPRLTAVASTPLYEDESQAAVVIVVTTTSAARTDRERHIG
jgi:hypothetical protein